MPVTERESRSPLTNFSSFAAQTAPPRSQVPSEQILARYGRSFWLASRFLPADIRRDVTTIYAFFRYLDDLADTDTVEQGLAAQVLQQWYQWVVSGLASSSPEPTLAKAVAGVYRRYHIPTAYTADLISGILSDITPRQIRTRDELYRYCYQVGGTVGLTLAPVLGVRCDTGQAAANALGIAMQLTNITRDLGEDLRRQRLYLPTEDLSRYGIELRSLYHLAQTFSPPTPQLQMVVRLQITRARQIYERARIGYRCLPERVRFGIIAAAEIYAAILRAIERNRFDTVRVRAIAGYDDKLCALLRAWQAHLDLRRQGDQPCRTCGRFCATR
ncbi:phytoene/squalene synthase family protein [Thermomicrobium sp. 4228-Ro]|uniref:phytoene/squalene synthase family protein n=1 Tax=Thermomicrobium sp. 4228-Ro TaxID=2993937 RepID=UPI0022488B07|nr:phytoene/squalene synthase family protein [Thermomicrobium sp. 4228-Ro]MCX2727569.1 phytoene/squalene synthase family protein [Thermomicrobium sp. 4228-Ro]